MRDFSGIRRIVIKIGTNLLAPDGVPDVQRIESLATDITELKQRDIFPIIVSSGAIGFGSRILNLESRPRKVEMRQACAAVGQPVLMQHWQNALGKCGVVAAQILLSRESFDDRKSFLNLKNAVEHLLDLGAIPVMNENDSVSTTEIGNIFGDNDSLSAHIASKLDAGLLILLTDIDALYDKNPRDFPQARPLHIVKSITDDVRASAGEAGSDYSTGGMVTKLQAVEIAARAGCRTVLADGRKPSSVIRILDGEDIGTLFLAGSRQSARKRWISGARSRGKISIDEGALKALSENKSLLPKGIIGVDGVFDAGEVVQIGDEFKAITTMNSAEIQMIMGRHSQNVKDLFGKERRKEVALADDIVDRK